MSKRILIIEDEESIADLEKDYLELSNFEVQIEENGREGLKRALEEDFDMFILDLMLPDMDGFDICKEIRRHHNRREGRYLLCRLPFDQSHLRMHFPRD